MLDTTFQYQNLNCLLVLARKAIDIKTHWTVNIEEETSTQIFSWKNSEQSVKVECTQTNNDQCTLLSIRVLFWNVDKNGKRFLEFNEKLCPTKEDYPEFCDFANTLYTIAAASLKGMTKEALTRYVIQSGQKSSVNSVLVDDPPNNHWTEILTWEDSSTYYHYTIKKEYFDPNESSFIPVNYITVNIIETADFFGIIIYHRQIAFAIIIHDDLIKQFNQITPKK